MRNFANYVRVMFGICSGTEQVFRGEGRPLKSFQELCSRYGIGKSTFSEWLRAHRKEIDPKGNLIEQTGRKLLFTEAAVDKIDKLRGFEVHISLFEAPAAADQAELEALKTENNTLKTQILMLQQEIINAQKQTIAAAAALNAATAAQIENAAEKARREAEIEALKVENERLRLNVSASSSQRRRGNRWWR